MKRILAACGNDCSVCPRYVKHPFEKTGEQLQQTAQLWFKIGYRDHVVTKEEIACTGCKADNWCRYHIAACCEEKHIANCAKCDEYPCSILQDCFRVTESFGPMCRKVCTAEEYAMLQKAFFEKEKNLSEERTGA